MMAQLIGPSAVLLIAHGSRYASANDDLHQLAARLSDRGDYPIIESCFLELAEPDIQAGGARCVARGARRVLMVPYFLSAGVHLLRDLTAARDALHRHYPEVEFRLGPALGPHPLLEQLVLERIRRLDTTDTPPTLATSSELAEYYAPSTVSAPAEAGRSPGAGPCARAIDRNGPKD